MKGALHVLEHRLLIYRRTYRGSLFSSFLSPVLFLAAMGIGLGSYVDGSGAAGTALTAGVSYAAFLAPGLLAANAMQTEASGNSQDESRSCNSARKLPDCIL